MANRKYLVGRTEAEYLNEGSIDEAKTAIMSGRVLYHNVHSLHMGVW